MTSFAEWVKMIGTDECLSTRRPLTTSDPKEVRMAESDSNRPISVRTRFEIFKRDDFQCRYCGQRSPEVVLEIDHIVPRVEGGTNDVLNLITSCWDCNRGKGGVPLANVMTSEDPHDKAIEMMERRRQLDEYNAILEIENTKREEEMWEVACFWNDIRCIAPDANGFHTALKKDLSWIKNTLKWCPKQKIKEFMELSIGRGMKRDMRYVVVCCRTWREERFDRAAY